MGQISKFLLPGMIFQISFAYWIGSKRIDVTGSTNLSGTLSYVGVITPNKDISLVVMNQGNSSYIYLIFFVHIDRVPLRFIDNGLSATYTIPPRAITTFVYPNFWN